MNGTEFVVVLILGACFGAFVMSLLRDITTAKKADKQKAEVKRFYGFIDYHNMEPLWEAYKVLDEVERRESDVNL